MRGIFSSHAVSSSKANSTTANKINNQIPHNCGGWMTSADNARNVPRVAANPQAITLKVLCFWIALDRIRRNVLMTGIQNMIRNIRVPMETRSRSGRVDPLENNPKINTGKLTAANRR
jgi:hypothetical protein